MRSMMLLLSISTVLSGCTVTKSWDAEDGGYYVRSGGSALRSSEAYANNIEKRAKKLCPAGFEYVDDGTKSEGTSTNVVVNGSLTSVSGSRHLRKIRCSE